jgi:hypothetical protein
VQVWEPNELPKDWAPPACTGWTAPGFSMLVATAGRFRGDDLRRRLGAVSAMSGMIYWSTTDQRWKKLILGASAVEGDKQRKDFALEEIAAGRTLYFEQEDEIFGKATYRVRIIAASEGRLVFETENVSTLRYLVVPIFQPGEMQLICFLDREAPDVWKYYSLSRTRGAAGALLAGHKASFVNRAVALYRYFAKIPYDREPPAAR